MRDALPPQIPLTVKLRRGMDDTAESRDKFFAIFDGAFARGAVAATVHGRTVRQRYEGTASWDFLRELKRHAGARTVLGSGDLFTPRACLDMMAQTGVDGVSIARGAIGNPWMFGQVRALAAGGAVLPPTLGQQRTIIAEHYRLAEELYGPKHAPSRMRNSASSMPACTRSPSRSATPSWPSPARPISTRCWRSGTRKTFRPSWQRHGVKRLTPRCQGQGRKGKIGCWWTDAGVGGRTTIPRADFLSLGPVAG